MRRLSFLLVALLVLASACSAFGAAPAATVGGTDISTDEIDDEIEIIRSNDAYTQVLEQSYGAPTEGSGGKGTFDAAFVAQVLSLRVWYEALEQDLDDRGLLPIPDDVLADARDQMQQQFASLDPEAFESFPEEYQERLVEQRALIAVVENDVAEQIGDDEEAFFEENPDDFAEICVAHALVGLQGGRTATEAEERATELRARIDEGTSFTEIATNESDDPGAAAQGGELGCGSRLTMQFDPVFEEAAFALEEGEVSEPVETQFGWHLILVTERTMPDYDEVADTVGSVMSQALNERINRYLVQTICEGDIDVNPRYGTWTSETCDSLAPQIPSVQPPEGPRVTEPTQGFDLSG